MRRMSSQLGLAFLSVKERGNDDVPGQIVWLSQLPSSLLMV